MKTFRTTKGPFSERPYYKDQEIEQICIDALNEVGLLPRQPEPIRIDRFIEKRFGVVPSYEDLPEGVLGLTRFGKGGVQEVVISNALDADSARVTERRVRTTLAHEAGHCLLHTHLFALASGSRGLFGDFSDPDKPKVLCRDESTPAYSGQWWEFQANMAMGQLLMPRLLTERALEPFLVSVGSIGGRTLNRTRTTEATTTLSKAFDVNPVVARIRIDSLYPASEEGQLSL